MQRLLLDRIDLNAVSSLPGDEVRREIGEVISQLLDQQGVLSEVAKERATQEVVDEIVVLGPLEPLMRDETVSDILVNAADTVYVEGRGVLELAPVRFRDNAHLLRVIERIVARVGRRVDESSPLLRSAFAALANARSRRTNWLGRRHSRKRCCTSFRGASGRV